MNNTALSTVVVTPFADNLTANLSAAICHARAVSTENGSPVGIWHRDGWYTVCDVAPEMIEPDPELSGWTLARIVFSE